MAQRFGSLIGNSPELRPLLTRAQTLFTLQQLYASVAPDYLARSSMVLGLHFGTLTISAANSTVAAKLRQLAPELVVLLQNRGCEVSGIRVKVQVSHEPLSQVQPPRLLSRTALFALGHLGETLEDSPLKLALTKLTNAKGQR